MLYVFPQDYEVRAQDDRPDIGPYVCVGLSLANHSSASMRDFEISLSHSKDIKFVQQVSWLASKDCWHLDIAALID